MTARARSSIAWCDIFITNQTNRMVERWGFTYDELKKINPTIIAAYQPMQGFDGPHKDFFGFGAVLNAITGYNELSGFPNRPPMGLGTNYPDYVINPGHTLIAILAALRYRKRTGKGQRVELAQLESSVAPLAPAVMDYTSNGRVQTRKGNRISYAAPHGAFRCKDGTWEEKPEDRWIAFGVFDDAQWRGAGRRDGRAGVGERREVRDAGRAQAARGRAGSARHGVDARAHGRRADGAAAVEGRAGGRRAERARRAGRGRAPEGARLLPVPRSPGDGARRRTMARRSC